MRAVFDYRQEFWWCRSVVKTGCRTHLTLSGKRFLLGKECEWTYLGNCGLAICFQSCSKQSVWAHVPVSRWISDRVLRLGRDRVSHLAVIFTPLLHDRILLIWTQSFILFLKMLWSQGNQTDTVYPLLITQDTHVFSLFLSAEPHKYDWFKDSYIVRADY